jgi:hypothetical protein
VCQPRYWPFVHLPEDQDTVGGCTEKAVMSGMAWLSSSAILWVDLQTWRPCEQMEVSAGIDRVHCIALGAKRKRGLLPNSSRRAWEWGWHTSWLIQVNQALHTGKYLSQGLG